MIDIRFAKTTDTQNIRKFINSHWMENHILSRDKDFFLYEFQDNEDINFVIATDNQSNIYAVLGFIKSSTNNSDIWTAIWKAINHKAHPMLGVELLDYLRNTNKYNRLISNGINSKTIAIYDYFGFYTNYLNQYVIINNNIQNFNILKISGIAHLKKVNLIENSQYSLIKLKESELDFDFDSQEFIPHKDENYFIKRYFNHPIYIYDIYGIYKEKTLTSIIVMREVALENSKILRIMDYLGDEKDIAYITSKIYQIIVNKGYEYVDFVCFGFDNANLKKAGFLKINLESAEVIVPNYFSPFVQENIKLNFMVDTKEINKLRMCKADGDQDRPN